MLKIEEHIRAIVTDAMTQIAAAADESALYKVRVEVLGKSGSLKQLLKQLKDVRPEDRPAFGKRLNEAESELDEAFRARDAVLKAEALSKKLQTERVDITIDRRSRAIGGAHPLYAVKARAVEFFTARGFMIADSPEIETEYYNFDALNMPFDHPARDTQDTFYITDSILLRTQTSPGQIRTMEAAGEPPIKMITVGKVYRSDDIDATHSPMFHQIEGLAVDKGITMCDLKGILTEFAAAFFGKSTVTRFRPSYFPFTEPSVEVDASCPYCDNGCRVCKGTGWIEILGAGMVNRRVLRGCGIDPDVYTGFAFGIGLDRITLIMHGISDLRLVYENDIRFLKQFS